MQWSHSSLKDFENCARKYHETRILKRYPRGTNEQAIYGERLHAVAEEYVKAPKQEELPQEFAFLKPSLDALIEKPGTKHTELELALDEKLRPCNWRDKEAWVRGIVDLLILDDARGWLVDYKSGKAKYADKGQLDLMSLLVFAHYPEVQRINSALIFVTANTVIKHRRLRSEERTLWLQYRERVSRIERAYETDVWSPSESGLCRKHCEVTTCEYNGRR